MSKKLQNLVVRALTGAVYVALLVGCTLHGSISCLLFFSAVTAATMWEYATLMNTHRGADINRPIMALSGVILNFAVWSHVWGSPQSMQMFALYGFTLLYLTVSELYRQTENPVGNWAYTLGAQLYIALPFALLQTITWNPQGYVWVLVLALFVFIWTNDTGAYLAGSALHKVFPAKLFERISPNKSWVGSIGGGLLTVGVSLLFANFEPSISREKWIGMALVVVVFGTWGDLVESLMKRQLGIKDSGHVLPGHGGMLDRFDSALLAIPAAVLYFIFVS